MIRTKANHLQFNRYEIHKQHHLQIILKRPKEIQCTKSPQESQTLISMDTQGTDLNNYKAIESKKGFQQSIREIIEKVSLSYENDNLMELKEKLDIENKELKKMLFQVNKRLKMICS